MQTQLAPPWRDTAEGAEAQGVLRKCVHCGFCLATCPTYQILGDELDSPRGRIYLMKEMLEGRDVSERTQLHLDRCLTCRACETTCPSGVEYSKLLDIGREHVEQRVQRGALSKAFRYALRKTLATRWLFGALLFAGRMVRPVLPASLRRKIPATSSARPWPSARHARKMLLLDGCVQPGLAPEINRAAAVVLDKLGISLLAPKAVGCCGAIAHHMNVRDEAREHARRNVDAWWPHIEAGAESIVVTASGCGPMLRDYAHLLRDDPRYAERAQRISAMVKDVSQIVVENEAALRAALAETPGARRRISFHSPCTLQHGMKLPGVAERVLRDAGFELNEVADSHLCCGSAGTYSIFQPALASQLLERKLGCLEAASPELIATANIGCLIHLRSAAKVPVVHWIEMLAQRLE